MITDKYIKTDVPGLVIDPRSGAILNVDNSALEQYRKQNSLFEASSNNEKRIKSLESDIGEIKSMLKLLIENKNN